jgi:transposase-like protein
MLRVVEKPSEANQELRTTLDEVLQRGALKMLQETLEAEVEDYITRHREARDERGRAQVVRNGKAPARQLVTGSGTLEVRAPRVNDRRVDADGERQRFSSEILPSYMRRAPKVTEVLPAQVGFERLCRVLNRRPSSECHRLGVDDTLVAQKVEEQSHRRPITAVDLHVASAGA